jgi:hypothetical protein
MSDYNDRVILDPERVEDVFWAYGEPVSTVARVHGVMAAPTLGAAMRDVRRRRPMRYWRASRLARSLGVSVEDLGPTPVAPVTRSKKIKKKC